MTELPKWPWDLIGIALGGIGSATWFCLTLVFRLGELRQKFNAMEEKTDIMWTLLMRRAIADAVITGMAKLDSDNNS